MLDDIKQQDGVVFFTERHQALPAGLAGEVANTTLAAVCGYALDHPRLGMPEVDISIVGRNIETEITQDGRLVRSPTPVI